MDVAGMKWVRVWCGPCRGLVVPVGAWGAWRVRLGGYEIELRRHFSDLVRPGDWFLDVGCGSGYYTLAAAKAGAVALGMDVDRERLKVAREAFRVNGLPGMLMEREVRRLPWGVDGVKMDVEGAEAGILERSTEVLRESGPRLLVEVHGPEVFMRCCAVLEDCGYEVEKVRMERSAFRGDVCGERAWLWAVPGEV